MNLKWIKKKVAGYFLAREDLTLLVIYHDMEWKRDWIERIDLENRCWKTSETNFHID